MNPVRTYTILAMLAIFAAAPALAQNQMDHGDMDKDMTHDSGQVIAENEVDGYALSYQLIDMRQMAQDMPEMTATHHLVLHIMDSRRHHITNAAVGFLIEGPDGSEQQVMAMAMGDGYGSDIRLSQPGKYTIKAKAVAGEKTLLDAFTHEVTAGQIP